MTHKITFQPGCHISDAAADLVAAASWFVEARGTFNGIELRATHDSDVNSIVAAFERESAARREVWLASPEAVAAKRRSSKQRARLQAVHDALVARLPTLDFNDPYAVLDWLCAMQEPSDYRGVVISRDAIVTAFESHGYRSGECCGDEYRPGDKDNMFHYLVGQALEGLKNGPAIHGVIHKFAAEWRERWPNPHPLT